MNDTGLSIEVHPGFLEEEHRQALDLFAKTRIVEYLNNDLRAGLVGEPRLGGQIFYRAGFELDSVRERQAQAVHMQSRMSFFANAVRELALRDAEGRYDAVVVVCEPDMEAALAVVFEALMPSGSTPELFFVADIASFVPRLLADCDPQATLVVAVSPDFSDPLFRMNFGFLQDWLRERLGDDGIRRNCVAVTRMVRIPENLGLSPAQIFAFPDDIDAHAGVFSPAMIPLEICLPARSCERLRLGAACVDRHMLNTRTQDNTVVACTALEFAMLFARSQLTIGHVALGDRLMGLGTHLRNRVHAAYLQRGLPSVLDIPVNIEPERIVASSPVDCVFDVWIPTEPQDIDPATFAHLADRARRLLAILAEERRPHVVVRHPRLSPRVVGAILAFVEYRTEIARCVLAR